MKILYVEDNPVDIDLTRRFLKKAAPHIEMTEASCQKAALEILKSPDFNTYDMVLTDMALPDGDGIAILSFIRSRSLPVAVAILTGQGNEETAVAVLKSGADDYIIKKPGYLAHLPQALEKAFASYRSGLRRRNRPLQVLYLEHNKVDIDLTRRYLDSHATHITLTTMEEITPFRELCRDSERFNQFDVLLIDYRLPGQNALEVLKYLRIENKYNVPVILVTGKGDEEIAVRALKIGAFDYITKNSGYLHKLPFIIENAVYSHELSREHQALKESEARYRSLVDNINIGICMINRDMRILSANQRLQKWFPHIDAHKTPHCTTMFCCDGKNRILPDCPTRSAFQDGKVHSTLFKTTINGEKRIFHIVATPIKNGMETVSRVIEMIEDITELHIQQEKQLTLETQLLQAQKHEALGNLAGGIAHDFNNILSAIMGYSELALDEIEPESMLENHFKEIHQAGCRAKELTRQILTFARKSDSKPVALAPDAVVKETVHFLQSTVPASIEIRCHLNTDAKIMADPTHIHQIMMNLCTNAVHAMEEEGVLEIHLTETYDPREDETGGRFLSVADPLNEDPPEKFINLTINDSGCGIPEKILPHIFDPYFTTKESGRGTGLGLSVVQGIVHQYGGNLYVRSRINHGARFTILLPLFSETIETTEDAGPLPGLPGGNESILVVDDEISIMKMMKKNLERFSYRVVSFSTSHDALTYLREHPHAVDLVITDMTMPGLTGDRMAEEINCLYPGLPVIVASGYSRKISSANTRLDHISAILDKPISRQILLSTVREVLDRQQKRSVPGRKDPD